MKIDNFQGYLLDTNILSELTKPQPDKNVINWLEKQNEKNLFLSTITTAEILGGTACMNQGKKRLNLENTYKRLLSLFAERILPFGLKTAHVYALLVETAKRKGCPLSLPDGFIAAIALEAHLVVATRDTLPFERIGIKFVNPFDHET